MKRFRTNSSNLSLPLNKSYRFIIYSQCQILPCGKK